MQQSEVLNFNFILQFTRLYMQLEQSALSAYHKVCLTVIFVGFRGTLYVKHLATAALVLIVSLLFVACAVAAIAFTLDRSGHAMSWYSSTWLVFGLYVAPATGVLLLTCSAAKKLLYKVRHQGGLLEEQSLCFCTIQQLKLICNWLLSRNTSHVSGLYCVNCLLHPHRSLTLNL